MLTVVKNLPKSEVEVEIEVDSKILENARKEAILRFQREVKIEGFREGKVPDEKIVAKVGEKNITLEANDIAIKLSYAEAVKKENLKVVSYPKIKILSAEPLKFTATVAVLPEVEVGDWRKIKLKKDELKVEPKEIEAVIKDILKGNATATEVKDRAAQKGDRVEIDFAGTTGDGVPLDGAASKNHPLLLGEGNFIPGFEEGVEGMSVGEEKEHPVKFPDDYHAKHLAGKEVKFKIKLHKIEELSEPKLDDDFAKKVSGGQKEKWADVEKDIAKHLESQKEIQARQKLEADLVGKLLKIGKVELPEVLIEEEVEWMLKDLKNRLASGGMEWPKYLEAVKKTEEEIQKEMRVEGEKRVKVRLILDKLVETEKVVVEETEVVAAIEKEASRHPESQKKAVRENFAVGGMNRMRLQQQLKVIKLLDNLIKTLSKGKLVISSVPW
ncbi:trigger factor [Candidatus Gracilibacteria bacterium]|nr:trigger factor [Candidatus Gracilibacteria bacterium]MCF7856316.1 trigger factor [Candidatus Gracilibacteria bacterium]MCF7896671.1 trigger factor [Candidatus Gracilibacteria bacterium]